MPSKSLCEILRVHGNAEYKKRMEQENAMQREKVTESYDMLLHDGEAVITYFIATNRNYTAVNFRLI
ncbi:hypothetical protein D3C76_741200 [compost metagenome]